MVANDGRGTTHEPNPQAGWVGIGSRVVVIAKHSRLEGGGHRNKVGGPRYRLGAAKHKIVNANSTKNK